MCRKFLILLFLPLLVILCGCEQLTLANGKYEASLSGREDFAAIYDDLIFLRVREPSEDPSVNSYWDWAGKFDIENDGRIILKMDKDIARKWNFHYDFYRNNGMITVYDHSSQNSYNLRYRPASAGQRSAASQTQGDFNSYK